MESNIVVAVHNYNQMSNYKAFKFVLRVGALIYSCLIFHPKIEKQTIFRKTCLSREKSEYYHNQNM